MDTHQEMSSKCPRNVTMMKPSNGLGHETGTFTKAMTTALFCHLTYVDAPLKFCPPLSVCCSRDWTFVLDGLLHLGGRMERWKKIKRLEKNVTDLKAMLSR